MKRLLNAVATLLLLCGVVVLAQRNPAGFAAGAGNLQNQVRIDVRGEFRYIESNGIPNHEYGQFPNRHNPNTISAQRHRLRVPVSPTSAAKVTRLFLGPFGIAVNGVPFDPGAAEFWDRNPNSGWQYEALSGKIDLGMDANNAHVQPTGAYHYHGLPLGLIKVLGGGEKMLLLGYAADGFPIYSQNAYAEAQNEKSDIQKMRSSYRVKAGTRPSGPKGRYDGTFVEDYEFVAGAGDLDECNGRQGVTPEYPEGTYYYCLTEEFPFIPRAFRGTTDESFRRGPGPGGRGGPPGRRGPLPPGRRPPPPRPF